MKLGRVLVILALLAPTFAAALELPDRPLGRVSDFAKILSDGDRERVEEKLKSLGQGTTRQIAIALFSSLEQENLEDFSIRLAERWKIGSRASDDGVLLTAFMEEHKLRIEVGYGLEDKLTDAICSRIISERIAPSFRHNDIASGLLDAIEAIEQVSRGEKLVSRGTPMPAWAIVLLVILALTFIGLPLFLIVKGLISLVHSIRMLGFGGYIRTFGTGWMIFFAIAFGFSTLVIALIQPGWAVRPSGNNFLDVPWLSPLGERYLPDGAWESVIRFHSWFAGCFIGLVIEIICAGLGLAVVLALQGLVPVIAIGLIGSNAIRGRDHSPKRRWILLFVALVAFAAGGLILSFTGATFPAVVLIAIASIFGMIGALPENLYDPFRIWLDKKAKESLSKGGFSAGDGGWSSSSSGSSSFSGGGGSFGGGGSSGSW